jgi:hypothetical protein
VIAESLSEADRTSDGFQSLTRTVHDEWRVSSLRTGEAVTLQVDRAPDLPGSWLNFCPRYRRLLRAAAIFFASSEPPSICISSSTFAGSMIAFQVNSGTMDTQTCPRCILTTAVAATPPLHSRRACGTRLDLGMRSVRQAALQAEAASERA